MVARHLADFAECPAQDRDFDPLTALEALRIFNSAHGAYVSPDEILAVPCVFQPGALFVDGEYSANLATEWSGFFDVRSVSSGLLLPPFAAAGIASSAGSSVNVVIFRAIDDDFDVNGLTLRWVDGNWLIQTLDVSPECSEILDAASDPEIAERWSELAGAACG